MCADNNQHELEQDARQALNSSVDELSPEIQRRLQQARSAALEAQPKPRLRFPNVWLGWGLTASLCAAVYLSVGSQTEPQYTPELASNSKLEAFILMTSLDETELEIIEDLEFAYWISQQLDEDTSASASHRG